jgi:methyl-accepting chemotaxis protein
MKSIKLKISLPIILVIILGLSILTVISYSQSKTLLTNSIDISLESKASKLSSIIDGKINEWGSRVETLSEVAFIKNADMNATTVYFENQQGYEDFSHLIIADLEGNFENTLGKSDNIIERGYFQDALKEEKLVISDPIISKTTNLPMIVLAVPIKNDSGVITGVLAAAVNLSSITEIIGAEKFAGTGYSVMIDSIGTFLAHPNEEFLLTTNISDIESDGLKVIAKEMLDQKSGIGSYVDEGQEKVIAYNPIMATGWNVLHEYKMTKRVN